MASPRNSIRRSTLSDFFDEALYEKLKLDTSAGTALPNIAYTSHEYHEFEQNTLFRRTWVFAAASHQIENTGDMLPLDIAGQPVVLVRGEDACVRAFHNVCRHRGAKLVNKPLCSRKNFVCPNHSWSYSLKGKLLARPHFFGGDKHDVNSGGPHRADLAEIRCVEWYHWIFVNLDGAAAEFQSHVQTLEARLEGYDLHSLRFFESLEFDIRANWKLAIENFIEPYHVFSCHPWLHSFVQMRERDPPAFNDHLLYCGYEFQRTDPARGEGLPYFPDLPEKLKRRGDWYVLFPNFAFEIFPDQVDVFVASPDGPMRCRETISVYFVGDGADHPEYANARSTVVENWRELNAEDVGVIERMQAGRASEAFDGGVLSPYWDPVQQQFARLVVDALK